MMAESWRNGILKDLWPFEPSTAHTTLYLYFHFQILHISQNVFRQDRHAQHGRQDPVCLHAPFAWHVARPEELFANVLLYDRQLGYGTWQAGPGEVGNGVYEALKIGYRHLVSGLGAALFWTRAQPLAMLS